MGRKKKHRGLFSLPTLSLPFEVPERAKRLILSIVLLAIALIFGLAFFNLAGPAGDWLFDGGHFLLGQTVFVLPLFLGVAVFVLWGMEHYSSFLPLLGLTLITLSTSGALATFARSRAEDIIAYGGWIGHLISLPVFAAFGFWVGEVIFISLLAVGGVILWQLLPDKEEKEEEEKEEEEEDEEEKPSLANAAKEKVKKIFEPKFDVSDIEPEKKQKEEEDEEDEEDEEEEEEKNESKSDAEDYKIPPVDLLDEERGAPNAGDVKSFSAVIKKTLQNFDIPVEISEVNVGPAVTQYAFKPAEGIKLSRITALQNDLALALAAHPLRIEAPIPGRALVGIEIPNKTRATVRLRALLDQDNYKDFSGALPIALGKDVSGTPIYTDLARMPHLLVAGATGAGKTIGLSNIILSLLYKNSPSSLRLVLVDPKRVEFPVYNDLPHLLTPVIVDTQRTLNALKWLTKEMDRRFGVFSEHKVRDIRGYHAVYAKKKNLEEIPYIVCVIDELADLMMARGKELEGMIVRLAQMSRAVGIHLVLATQRPSVEVLTGLIKANITGRIAFQVNSQIDSRTILDASGAEKLLGQGDMLFVSAEFSKSRRIQGAYVSEKEVKKVVKWIDEENEDLGHEEMEDDDLSQRVQDALENDADDEDADPLYEEAKRVVIESGKASASLLQRRLKLGYARAARLIDLLEERGVVGPADGAKPREVYANRGREEGKGEEWLNP